MTYYIRNGNKFNVTDDASLEVHRSLPVGNYIVQPDAFGHIWVD